MDEVWVPTLAAREAFVFSGVPVGKIIVVPEPVDTDFFTHQPFVNKRERFEELRDWQISPFNPRVTSDTFMFLFVGKFEFRKGIRLLLRAYYEAFFSPIAIDGEVEDVLLCILTSAYHSTDDFFGEVERYLLEDKLVQSVPLEVFLSKIVLYTDIPQAQMPVLYTMANILVIPSRGEGWGRPHVEAMSCGVPVIATNWSGPTAYLTQDNGFPLQFDDLVPSRDWNGHFWAEPSLHHLKELLRFTFANPGIVHEKGLAARQTMLHNFSLDSIGRLVWDHVNRIDKLLESGNARMNKEL